MKRNYTISLVNVAGLAIGLLSTLLIVLYISNEFSFDRFHQNAENIVKVEFYHKGNGQVFKGETMSYRFGEVVKESCPQVQDYGRITDTDFNSKLVESDLDHKNYETNFVAADNGFLRMFSFELVKGDLRIALTQPGTILLTQKMAEKYFGDTDPIGKVITHDKKYRYEVIGIIKNPPANSTLQFDFLADIESYRANEKRSMAGYLDKKQLEEVLLDVGASGTYKTFFLLNNISLTPKVAALIPTLLTSNSSIKNKDQDSYELLPLKELHFLHLESGAGAKQKVTIFGIVGVLILSLSLINYINLTTSRSTVRSGEIAVRKIVGAARKMLVAQFYIESALYSSIAFILAILLFVIFENYFIRILELQIDDTFYTNIWFLIPVSCLYFLSIVLSGIYPSLLLSGLSPIHSLKGGNGKIGTAANIRKALTVFQFTVSIVLVICSFLIAKQMEFFQKKDLGLNREKVLSVFLDEEDGLNKHYKEIKDEISHITGIESVAASSLLMYYPYFNSWDVKRLSSDKKVMLKTFPVDNNFIKTMGIKWAIAPRDQISINGKSKIILNETAAKELGIDETNYNEPLDLGQGIQRDVIGIIKDIHFTSLALKISPMALMVNSDSLFLNYLYIKLSKNSDEEKMLAAIHSTYDRYKTNRSFEYSFLNDTYNGMYKNQRNTGQVVYAFAGLALIIACLGLFGLTVFNAEQKRKEIGIRKVLGATVMNILMLLSREYIFLVIISIVIATPLAWFSMQKWLESFVYKIDIHWSAFAIAALISILLALFTVVLQGIKSALTNPVKSLQSE